MGFVDLRLQHDKRFNSDSEEMASMQVQGINDDLMVMLRNKLTTREQQLFLERFAVYLKYDDEDFVIDLDDVFQTVGFSWKESALKFVKNKLTESSDYKLIRPVVEHLHGGRPADQVMLTVNGFKQMCVLANTDAARQVRDDFMAMESVLHKYTKMKSSEQQRVILCEKELLLREKEAAEAHATLLLREKEAAEAHATLLLTGKEAAEAELQHIKQRVYEEVVKLDRVYINQEASEIGTDRHKVGKTFYEKKREGQLRTGAAQGSEMVYVRETSNAVIIENIVAVALKRYHIAREHYQCRLDHTRAIIDIACTVVDTLTSSYEFIGRDELFQKVIDTLHEDRQIPFKNTSSSSESQAMKNDVQRFIVDCVTEARGTSISTTDAYIVYRDWALDNTQSTTLSHKNFVKVAQCVFGKAVPFNDRLSWFDVRVGY
jgi:phage anti-repressor protein